MRTLAVTAVAVAVLAAAAMAAGAATTLPVPRTSADAVAKVGHDSIPRAWLEALEAYGPPVQAFPADDRSSARRMQSATLATDIALVALARAARARGLSVTKAALDAAVAGSSMMREAPPRLVPLLRGLTEDSLLEAKLRDMLDSAPPAKAHVAAYYREHIAEWTEPATRSIQVLMVSKRALADQLRAKLVAGASFATLARRYSEDARSSSNGGHWTVESSDHPDALEQVALALSTNGLSKVFTANGGWLVVKALAPTVPKRVLPLAAVEKSILARAEIRGYSGHLTRVEIVRKATASTVFAPGYELIPGLGEAPIP